MVEHNESNNYLDTENHHSSNSEECRCCDDGTKIPSFANYDDEIIGFQEKLQHVEDDDDNLEGAAGCTGAIVGLLIGGPIVAAVTGFGCAYAVRKDGKTGDIARSIGEVGILARDKARDVNRTHRLTERSKNLSEKLNSQYPLFRKAGEKVKSSAKVVIEYSHKNNFIERGIEGTGQAIEYIVEKFSRKSGEIGYESVQSEDSDSTEGRSRSNSMDEKIAALERELRSADDKYSEPAYDLDPSKF